MSDEHYSLFILHCSLSIVYPALMFAQLFATFTLGLLATASPCVLPLYPGFLAYLSSNSERTRGGRAGYWLGLCVWLGVMTMMIALALLIASFRVAVGNVLAVLLPLADAAILALGVLLLLNRNIFMNLGQVSAPFVRNAYANAFIYGLLYGPIALPCSGPFLVSSLLISLSLADTFSALLSFIVFGFGFGIPLLVLSLLARSRQDWLIRQFMARHIWLERAAGVVLIALALYDFYSNLPSLQLYWTRVLG